MLNILWACLTLILAVAAFVVAMCVLLLVLEGLWKIMETVFYEKRACMGIVENKYVTDEKPYPVDTMVAEIFVTVIETYPAEWHVQVLAPEISGDIPVPEDKFKSVHTNQIVTVLYRVNRITGTASITGIAA